jgi:4-hydroxybenzoate polyprenyltransferase
VVQIVNTMNTAITSPRTHAVTRIAGAYWITMRPYLLFVSGITGIVGMAAGASVATSATLLIAAAAFFSYGFGQALTDVFQTDTDRISSPYRPLVRGEITHTQVFCISLIGLCAVGAVFVGYAPVNAIYVTASVLGLASYTWFKRRWWGGPFWNAAIVVVLYAIGRNAAGAVCTMDATTLGTTAVVFFGYANFVLSGYFKDIEADRATGYNTFPVVFGRRAAALVSDGFAIAAASATVVVLAVLHSPTQDTLLEFIAWVLAAAGIAASVVSQVMLHRVTSDDDSHGAIALTVWAYILLCAAIASALRPEWSLPLIGFFLAFLCTLHMRPSRTQI